MPYLDKAGLTYFWAKVKTIIGGKVDKETGKGLSSNDYTTAEKTKLSGIETQANKTTIANNLTTTVEGSALDATQGKALSDAIATKVDKVTGKGLSTNDYTTSEKNKLAGIADGANKTTVDSAMSSSSTNPVQNKVINTALAGKVNTSTLVSSTFSLTPASGVTVTASACRKFLNVVSLSALFTFASTTAKSINLGTVPSGYRPIGATVIYGVDNTNDTAGQCQIGNSDGKLMFYRPNTTAFTTVRIQGTYII